MGFHNGAFAKVWKVEQGKGRFTNVRLSVSKKQQDGTYAQDFSGFCMFIGNAHAKAAMLKGDERIRLGDVDVSNSYDKEKGKEYINYKVFDFEFADGAQNLPTKSSHAASGNPIEGNDTEDEETPF